MDAPKIFKFGIIGTSCAGKTTLAHAIVARLKSYGILADGLFSQDRKFTFDKKYLPTEAAQNMMITNLISKEVDLSLHGDVEVLITDRTPIDLFAYYSYQHETPLSQSCWNYSKEWAKTYEALYFLDPLPYHNDGKRPSDEFRLAVDSELRELIQEVPNVFNLGRHDVLNDILKRISFQKPGVKSEFTKEDAQTLANHIKKPVVVKQPKKPNSRDTLSDYDVWIVADFDYDIQKVRDYAFGLFGMFVPLEINLAVGLETFDFDYIQYDPKD